MKAPCRVTLEGIGEAEAEISCNGQPVGTVALPAGSSLEPVKAVPVTIPAAEEATVKLTVKHGVLTVKNVIFEY